MYQYEQAIEGQQFTKNAYVFTQVQGIQAFAAQFLINFHKVNEESDMQAYNARIGAISAAISVLLERAQDNVSYGVRPPRFAYDGVVEQATALITGAPFSESETDCALWADAKRKITALVEAKKIDQACADELKAQTKKR